MTTRVAGFFRKRFTVLINELYIVYKLARYKALESFSSLLFLGRLAQNQDGLKRSLDTAGHEYVAESRAAVQSRAKI